MRPLSHLRVQLCEVLTLYTPSCIPCGLAQSPHGVQAILGSVATVIADVFRKNGNNVGSKFAKIMKILAKIDDVKSRGVI